MKQLVLIVCAVLLLLPTARAGAEPAASPDPPPTPKPVPNEWKEESHGKGVLIQDRAHPGSSLKEFRAVGTFDMPTSTIFAVLNDTESYPEFMPYTSETHVLRREKNVVLAYEHLDLPLMNDRDYTVRSVHEKSAGPAGTTYRIHWQLANDLGPAKRSGIVRVTACEGGWLLEPQGPSSTRATYTIFTDSGGALPAFIANNGSRIGIRKIFEAVRKRAKDPKYSAAPNESARPGA